MALHPDDELVDSWPTDEEMAERCGCGHTLGQHEYGTDLASCEHCTCTDFHEPASCVHRAKYPTSTCRAHLP